MYSDKDPIIARASAAGHGGIGIIRLSGARMPIEEIAAGLFRNKTLKQRHAHLLAISDASGNLID